MTVTAPPIPAYRPFPAQVARVQRLSPSFLRVTFTGPTFGDLAPNGWDQRIKLLFPTAGRGLLDCPPDDDWYDAWRALPEERRNPMRTYTVRGWRPRDRELDVDFVLHGATGPASAWAERAGTGGEVVLIGPNARFRGATGGFEWRPPPQASRLLLAGDETAVPAICAIVESLPAGREAHAVLEVPTAADILPLDVPPGARVTWLPRWTSDVAQPAPRGRLLTDVVLGLMRERVGTPRPAAATPEAAEVDEELWDVPEEPLGSGLYTWLAGEAGIVTGLRRELVQGLGVDRRSMAFMGYWRAGRSG